MVADVILNRAFTKGVFFGGAIPGESAGFPAVKRQDLVFIVAKVVGGNASQLADGGKEGNVRKCEK